MPHETLDKFGKLLMDRVRDEVIDMWRRTRKGKVRLGDGLKKKIDNLTEHEREIAFQLVPDIVDSTIHAMMNLFEHEDVRVSVATDGEFSANLAEISDGLGGELYGDYGWIARFSNEEY